MHKQLHICQRQNLYQKLAIQSNYTEQCHATYLYNVCVYIVLSYSIVTLIAGLCQLRPWKNMQCKDKFIESMLIQGIIGLHQTHIFSHGIITNWLPAGVTEL